MNKVKFYFTDSVVKKEHKLILLQEINKDYLYENDLLFFYVFTLQVRTFNISN